MIPAGCFRPLAIKLIDGSLGLGLSLSLDGGGIDHAVAGATSGNSLSKVRTCIGVPVKHI